MPFFFPITCSMSLAFAFSLAVEATSPQVRRRGWRQRVPSLLHNESGDGAAFGSKAESTLRQRATLLLPAAPLPVYVDALDVFLFTSDKRFLPREQERDRRRQRPLRESSQNEESTGLTGKRGVNVFSSFLASPSFCSGLNIRISCGSQTSKRLQQQPKTRRQRRKSSPTVVRGRHGQSTRGIEGERERVHLTILFICVWSQSICLPFASAVLLQLETYTNTTPGIGVVHKRRRDTKSQRGIRRSRSDSCRYGVLYSFFLRALP